MAAPGYVRPARVEPDVRGGWLAGALGDDLHAEPGQRGDLILLGQAGQR